MQRSKSASIVTSFDGYPMAQDHRAERALALGTLASVEGGMISWAFLDGLSPALASFAPPLRALGMLHTGADRAGDAHQDAREGAVGRRFGDGMSPRESTTLSVKRA